MNCYQLKPPFRWLFFTLLAFHVCNAQHVSTDPSEVAALTSIFQQWNISTSLWEATGDPCTGFAINATTFGDDLAHNLSIGCNCTLGDGAFCHITKLSFIGEHRGSDNTKSPRKVYSLDKRGGIPIELTYLTYLDYLRIDLNYFNGLLPAFIGNLTELTFLSAGHNSLSGPIPKELGNLKKLRFLAIGTNNFEGSLPPELGNLVKLDSLYIDSCRLSGEIPSTFANLVNMQIMWGLDNDFTGKLPDFIGNWTKLINLRFMGNSFDGPIPSSYSKLVSLQSLRISDLSNVSSSLDFVKNMKNLTDLVLRNALISDTIPSEIGDFHNLQILDLSFNNLTGKIPSGLLTMSSLSYLSLGNNSLSGALPTQKAGVLQTIDLSYNELSGSFPPWVFSNVNLSLVANNFVMEGSNRSQPQGLYCLQRNFPCNRYPPRYTEIAIKCGGPAMRSGSGLLYDADNKALGPANYYVTKNQKWAVGNVGLFYNVHDPKFMYIDNGPRDRIVGPTVPQLFQSSRISASSLRYYGLGLVNGPYIVTLQFAETTLIEQDRPTHESLGRRLFDIYVQGKLETKDFDISKEAGGVGIVFEKKYYPTVTQNYLEIHLFWAGKGTCCVPEQGVYGPIISTLSIQPDFIVKGKKNNTGLIVGITISLGVAAGLVFIFALFYMKHRRSEEEREEEFLGIGPRPNIFSYSQLRTATNNFSPSNKLGEGGFGPVYKGTLADGRIVAVKQLSAASRQGKKEFATEIAMISAVQHRNLVKLYGCCIEGTRRLLVYEYLENKSLDQALFGQSGLHLDWPTRFSVCLGTARGLSYLHEESRPRIVHRDVKASNILLDSMLCPKISDFGLARLYDDQKTHISTRVAGTIGYLAPEYAMRGHLTEKADVFGFGVVALEIVSGRPNSDPRLDAAKIYLLDWAWYLYENDRTMDLVDPTLKGIDESEVTRVVGVALLCTQASPMSRPPMSRVVAMLGGDIELTGVSTKPSYLTDYDFKDISGGMTEGSSSTSDVLQSHKSKHSAEQNPILHDTIGEGR